VALDQHRLALERALPVFEESCAAQQLAVERPVAVRVGGGVDRHDATAGAYPALEGLPLLALEHARPVRLQQDHDVDLTEVLERGGIVGDPCAEALLERLAAGLDRVGVAIGGRAREDENVGLRLVATATGRDRQREDRGANPHGRRCYALTLPPGEAAGFRT
jgi:hypothetical protein